LRLQAQVMGDQEPHYNAKAYRLSRLPKGSTTGGEWTPSKSIRGLSPP
jgi:hypothetical protein